jgi:hypothetical protein
MKRKLKKERLIIVGSICLLEIIAFSWGTVTGDWHALEKVHTGFLVLTALYVGQFIQLG